MTEEIKISNAIINDTSLGFLDNGVFTAIISLDYGGGGQSFGNYVIKDEFIREVLKCLKVREWENLIGEKIRVKQTHNKIHTIGHFLEDKWFCPEEYYKNKEKENEKDNRNKI